MNAQTKRSRFKVLWAKGLHGGDKAARDVKLGGTAPKIHEIRRSPIGAPQCAKLML
jgi:hypothetical protein